MSGLTRSAAKERQRVTYIYKQAVAETTRAILMGGWSGLTPAQRRKQKANAEAFALASDCLKRALEETTPTPELHIVSGKPLPTPPSQGTAQ